jgi:hypothetical protein
MKLVISFSIILVLITSCKLEWRDQARSINYIVYPTIGSCRFSDIDPCNFATLNMQTGEVEVIFAGFLLETSLRGSSNGYVAFMNRDLSHIVSRYHLRSREYKSIMFDGDYLGPLSPNGEWLVYFSATQTDYPHINVINFNTGIVSIVSNKYSSSVVSWSADSQLIYYVNARGYLSVFDVNHGTTVHEDIFGIHPVISPNNSQILYTRDEDLLRHNLASQSEHRIARHASFYSWILGTGEVLFTSNRPEGLEVWMFDNITSKYNYIQYVESNTIYISPDGQMFAYMIVDSPKSKSLCTYSLYLSITRCFPEVAIHPNGRITWVNDTQ